MNNTIMKNTIEPKLDTIDKASYNTKDSKPIKKSFLDKLKKSLIEYQISTTNYKKINIDDQFEEIMKQSIEGLKLFADYERISEEEMIKYKSKSYTGYFEQAKTLNLYNFHITMLGIIDCQIDYFSKKENNKIHNSTLDDKNTKRKKELLTKRADLVDDIIKEIKPNSNIEEAIKTYPTHSTFSNLFQKMLEEHPYINTNVAYFSTSYNNGYCIGNYNKYEYYEYQYNYLKEELKKYKEKLDKKIEKVRMHKK